MQANIATPLSPVGASDRVALVGELHPATNEVPVALEGAHLLVMGCVVGSVEVEWNKVRLGLLFIARVVMYSNVYNPCQPRIVCTYPHTYTHVPLDRLRVSRRFVAGSRTTAVHTCCIVVRCFVV